MRGKIVAALRRIKEQRGKGRLRLDRKGTRGSKSHGPPGECPLTDRPFQDDLHRRMPLITSDTGCDGFDVGSRSFQELKKPLYTDSELSEDIEFIARKLGISVMEFESILSLPNRSHYDYRYNVVVDFMRRARHRGYAKAFEYLRKNK